MALRLPVPRSGDARRQQGLARHDQALESAERGIEGGCIRRRKGIGEAGVGGGQDHGAILVGGCDSVGEGEVDGKIICAHTKSMTTICNATATSSAPPDAFFARWADMDTWPQWNSDTEWARLDGPFAQGSTGVIKPRGGPKVKFVIETLVPDREFTDRSSLPGAHLVIRHRVAPAADGTCRIDVTVSLGGPLARLWRPVLAKGVGTSTPAGLDRLVEVVERDIATAR